MSFDKRIELLFGLTLLLRAVRKGARSESQFLDTREDVMRKLLGSAIVRHGGTGLLGGIARSSGAVTPQRRCPGRGRERVLRAKPWTASPA